ncbi:MAG TPA: hypothetical protein VH252_00265 [Chthoniobacterales bacterium]|jgi:hypothetical protein|nr:hypothetical protein [Chthoniobacterales bacterium]
MKSWTFPRAAAFLFVCILFSFASRAADSSGWAGQYRNDKFLGGRAVFQLTIEQSGNAMQVSFDAAWVDGHGAAPDAEGPATVSGNTLTFKFEDSFGNTGTGTIRRVSNDILVSITPTHVAEPRCLAFYGNNMRLKRVAKK